MLLHFEVTGSLEIRCSLGVGRGAEKHDGNPKDGSRVSFGTGRAEKEEMKLTRQAGPWQYQECHSRPFGLDPKENEQPLRDFKQRLTLTLGLTSHVDLILAHVLCITHQDCIVQIFPHLLPSRPYRIVLQLLHCCILKMIGDDFFPSLLMLLSCPKQLQWTDPPAPFPQGLRLLPHPEKMCCFTISAYSKTCTDNFSNI